MKRVAVVGSASGSGKTTLARTLAARMGGAFIEIDAHRHGPNWTTATAEELHAKIAPLVATDSWAIDGIATKMLGGLVVDRVELVVWLDLPPWVWLPRLLGRSARRWLSREELWNGNRENLRGIFLDADGVLPHAFRAYFVRRAGLAAQLAPYRPLRLCSVREVEAFVAAFASEERA